MDNQDKEPSKNLEKPDTPAEPETDGPGEDSSFPFPTELLDKLPEDQKRSISSFFTSASFTGSLPNPLAQKITPKHIDEMIAAGRQDSELEFEDRKHSRVYTFWAAVIMAVTIAIVMIMLADRGQNELLFEVIKLAATFFGGLGGGYGIASYRNRR